MKFAVGDKVRINSNCAYLWEGSIDADTTGHIIEVFTAHYAYLYRVDIGSDRWWLFKEDEIDHA